MKRYDLDKVIDRSDSNCDKWECMHFLDPRADSETLPFWVADMDFQCCDAIIEALKQRVDKLIFGYGCAGDEMFAVTSRWYRQRFSWELEPGSVLFSPGIVPAIGYLIDLLTKPGDGVMIFSPVYYPFADTIQKHGRRVVSSSLVNDGSGYYTMDFDDFERNAKDNKLLIFCSPHNPVGRVWSVDELKKLVNICKRNGVTVISDEIHNDLILGDNKHTVLETVAPDYAKNIITCVAPTKTFNIAGLQYSNIVIHDESLRQRWCDYVNSICGVGRPNVLTIRAVQAAYTDGGEWLSQVVEYLGRNMQLMEDYVKSELPESVFRKAEGTYLAWLDLRGYGFDSETFGRLITSGKILVENGSVFGVEGNGFIRMNIACSKHLLIEGLKRMKTVICP